MRAIVIGAILASSAITENKAVADDAAAPDAQLVILNASPHGDRSHMDRIKRGLDARGMLLKLPERLEAQLAGTNVLIADVAAIRTAYTKMELTSALELVQSDETRILRGAATGDPGPALAELAAWRGLIAVGLEHPDEAVRHFRTAQRLDPSWQPDRRSAAPKILALVKKARHEVDDTGRLRVIAEPDTAMMQIDDSEPQSVKSTVTLPAGTHLVIVSAEGHTRYAELVDVTPDKTYKLAITLEPGTTDRVAKLLDATIAAPSGRARLVKTRELSQLSGAKRFLVIEDGSEDQITVRLYDIGATRMSKPLAFDGETSSAAIARKVIAALDPDNMVDANVKLADKSKRWYEHWYVWAGIAAVAGGGYLTYDHATR